MFNTDKFKNFSSTPIKVLALYVDNNLWEEVNNKWLIQIQNIFINDNDEWKIIYIVQPGDNLSTISSNFGATTKHIKKINMLKSDTILPWQKLLITQEEGIIFNSKGETIQKIAALYEVDIVEIININNIKDENYKTEKWEEIFIPISDEKLQTIRKNSPAVSKSTYIPKATPKTYYKKWKNIISRYWWKPYVKNWFYRWHCTRFVAIKKFPYLTKGKQNKLWGGNAKNWYYNAKKAWYKVGTSPQIESIIVLKYGGRNYYSYWHVAIVKNIDRAKKLILVEEMNASWRYIVTQRWIPMDSNIIWYIYY